MKRLAQHTGLIALDAPVKLDPSTAAPTRIVALAWGENQTAQGPVIVGPKTLAASKLWDGLGFGEVAIDFNHNTVPGHPSYQGEPAPIAAMSALSVIEDVGLVFDCIQWTPEGMTNRANYKDFSPAVKLDEFGEVVFCHSGALARNGATHGLHLFSAESIPADLATKLTTLMAKAEPAYTAKTPTVHKPGTYMINTDLLKKILKAPADATDDDINSLLEQFGQTAATAEDPTATAAAGDDAGTMKALSVLLGPVLKKLGVIEVQVDKGTKALDQVTALSARLENSERQAIITEAESLGKQVPTEWLPDKDGKGGLPVEQLRTLCATLPEIVPLSARTPKTVKTEGKPVISPTDREVMNKMNLTEEQWLKHNAA